MTGDELVAMATRLAPLIELRQPAEAWAFEEAEARLGFTLPEELRAFLACSDGATIAIRLDSGEVIPRALPLVWDLWTIQVENTSGPDWAPDRPKDVLWFADAGVDGINIGHATDPRGAPVDQVVLWYPIEGEIKPFFASFAEYLERWIQGVSI